MTAALTLLTSAPLASLEIITARPAAASADGETAALKERLTNTLRALEMAAEGLEQVSTRLTTSCHAHIAHLAVEIAERILASQIDQSQYKIENIVSQALASVPTGKPVVLRLNPVDAETLEKNAAGIPELTTRNLRLVPDESVGPAQCIIETTDGIIEYLIKEHLKQIEAALTGKQ